MEQFPEGLREALARADEDYLMGLSNKGTVNRGKKDLQGYSPLVRIQGEEASGGGRGDLHPAAFSGGQRLYLPFQGNLPPPDHGHPVGQGAGGGPEYGGRGVRFLSPPGLPR